MGKKRRFLYGSTHGGKHRHRDRSPQSGEEVLTARDRFKGALQDLLPHSDEDDDDSDSTDDDRDRPWVPPRYAMKQNKRLSGIRKKQIEKPVEQEQSGFRQPFVMKLFDRSVDLAQFTEQTPLYPICRAWIANQPHQTYNNNIVKKKSRSPSPKDEPDRMMHGEDDSDSELVKDTYKLPMPDRQVYGNNKIRVPSRIEYHTRYTKIEQDGVELPTRDQLLQDNLAHWTNVRQSWLDASAKNEMRYRNSFKILLAIFNKEKKYL